MHILQTTKQQGTEEPVNNSWASAETWELETRNKKAKLVYREKKLEG